MKGLYHYLKLIVLMLALLYCGPFLVEGILQHYKKYFTTQAKVGVIALKGSLDDSAFYNKKLHTFFKDESIKAILMTIECSGGAAGTSQAIFTELLALKKDYPKPVVALIENICTSGGYYIACATDHIIAPGSALIGGISASMYNFFQVREFIGQHTVKYTATKAGKYKDMINPRVDVQPPDDIKLHDVAHDAYQQCAADIAQRRKLSMNTLSTWADGKVFSGRQALQAGLIDQVGSAHNAVVFIKERALIEGDIEWIQEPEIATCWWTTLTG